MGRVKSALVNFTQNTTMHGIRFITDSAAHFVQRCAWITIMLGCTAFVAYQISDRVQYYFTWPVTVSLEMYYNTSMAFPAIVFCNMNNFRITEASRLGYVRLLQSLFTNKTEEARLEALQKYNASNLTMQDLMYLMGHTPNDTVVSCVYDKQNCGPENFTMGITDHGLCMFFNRNPGKSSKVSEAGATHGLSVIVNIQQYEYMLGRYGSAGLRFMLFPPNNVPRVGELGDAVATGDHTFVGIKFTQTINLPPKRGLCSNAIQLVTQDHYTELTCRDECIAKTVIEKCKCRVPHLPHMPGADNNCTLSETYGCVDPVLASVQENKTCNICPISCHSSVYTPTFSYSTTSDLDVERMKLILDVPKLTKEFGNARDVRYAVEPSLLETDEKMITRTMGITNNLDDVITKALPEALEEQIQTLTNLSKTMKDRIGKKAWLNRFQRYLCEKSFFRGFLINDERYFSQVSPDFVMFANKFETTLNKLQSDDVIPSQKEIFYTELMFEIDLRLNSSEKALEQETFVYQKYVNASIILKYSYSSTTTPEDCAMAVPKYLIAKYPTASNSRWYTRSVSYLTGLQKDYVEMKAYLTGAYTNTTANATRSSDKVLSGFIYHAKYFLGTLYNMKTSVYNKPMEIMKERIDQFVGYEQILDNIFQNMFISLKNMQFTLNRIQTGEWADIKSALGLSEAYTTNQTIGKTMIAKALTTPRMDGQLKNLDAFFTSTIRGSSGTLREQWMKLKDASKTVWEFILTDEDSFDYYDHKNWTWAQRNYSLYGPELENQFENYTVKFDLTTILNMRDSEFTTDIWRVQAAYRSYITGSIISKDFYLNNFLQMDIFYREMSYEKIEQQVAYDIFALLSDIGGSLGLFVGASIITLFELIDVFIFQIPLTLPDDDKKKRITEGQYENAMFEKEVENGSGKKENCDGKKENIYSDIEG